MFEVHVSTDARRACSCGVIGSMMGAYPRGTGSNPVKGNGHFFSFHASSSIFRLSLTHTHTHTCADAHTHIHTHTHAHARTHTDISVYLDPEMGLNKSDHRHLLKHHCNQVNTALIHPVRPSERITCMEQKHSGRGP